jgi:hypothetical protein
MWPWGHAALAYLTYRLLVRGAVERFGLRDLSVLVVGAGLPDLVDKTLAWYLGLLASGRSLAHSALAALMVTAVAGYAVRGADSDDRLAWAAFAVGYWAHLAGDLIEALLTPPTGDTVFLLYPLRSVPPPSGASVGYYAARLLADLGAFLATGHLTGTAAVALLELALVAVAVAVWTADGRPGWRAVRERARW